MHNLLLRRCYGRSTLALTTRNITKNNSNRSIRTLSSSFVSSSKNSSNNNNKLQRTNKYNNHNNIHYNSKRYYTKSTILSKKEYPPHTLYPMPALSPTMEVGTISEWLKNEGDEFSAGDVLCSIETDKATVDFESQDDGILAKILQKPNTELNVGVPICVVVDDADDVAAFADFTVDTAEAAAAPAEAEAATTPPAAEPTSTASASSAEDDGNRRVPSIQFLGKDGWSRRRSGEDPTIIPTTAATAVGATPTQAAAVPPPPASTPIGPIDIPMVDTNGTYEDVSNNNMRKIIAKRLTESKRDVPHFYTSVEVELDELMKFRKVWKDKHDIKISVNDIIIKSSALALRDVPEVNSSYNSKTDSLQTNSTIDISVAVATPTGLITPIVPKTDTLGLSEITNKVKDLAKRARDGKLAPEEYQGGTFTISNLGMFGINEFSAVINPPQAAILAIGGGTKTIVPTLYDPEKEIQDNKPTIKTLMTARLSADRRVVDETTTSLFLSAFCYYMNKPELLLL